MSAHSPKSEFGLYVHIPYCVHKCPYCDFNSYAITGSGRRSKSLKESEYVFALIKELEYYASIADWKDRAIRTIFFGGGTPSLFEAESIAKVLSTIKKNFSLETEAEITLEANPGTLQEKLSLAKLQALRTAGVNRISMGVQSFSPHKLKQLGRIHGADDVPRAVKTILAADFQDFNLDLMFGVDNESLDDWKNDLQAALALHPSHISSYALTIEPGTEFASRLRHGTLKNPDEELQAQFFEACQRILEDAGYNQYEISNFSLPNKECRHNLAYWQGYDYLGIGAGAHSYRRQKITSLTSEVFGFRWSNIPGPEDYIKRCHETGSSVQSRETIDKLTAEIEFFFLRLRTKAGVSFTEYETLFEDSFQERYRETIAELQSQSLLQVEGSRIFLSQKGFLFANTVMEEFARNVS